MTCTTPTMHSLGASLFGSERPLKTDAPFFVPTR
jgi:hypothetical protein